MISLKNSISFLLLCALCTSTYTLASQGSFKINYIASVTDCYKDKTFLGWYKSWQDRIKKNCTSKELSHILMKKNNPLVIPRNHIVEEALNLAQEGDLSLFTEFLDALRSPYNIKDIPNRFLDPPPKDQRVYQTFCGT